MSCSHVMVWRLSKDRFIDSFVTVGGVDCCRNAMRDSFGLAEKQYEVVAEHAC